MNFHKIRRSTTILAAGYSLLIICVFTSLSLIGNYPWAAFLALISFPGFGLLTLGTGLVRKEQRFFNWSFYAFIAMDVLLITSITFNFIIIRNANYFQQHADVLEKLNTALKILSIATNTCLATANALIANGVKAIFIKEKNNKAIMAYCSIMEFGVSALLLFSSILGAYSFEPGLATTISTSVLMALDFLIQVSYCSFMIVVNMNIKNRCENNTQIGEKNDK